MDLIIYCLIYTFSHRRCGTGTIPPFRGYASALAQVPKDKPSWDTIFLFAIMPPKGIHSLPKKACPHKATSAPVHKVGGVIIFYTALKSSAV